MAKIEHFETDSVPEQFLDRTVVDAFSDEDLSDISTWNILGWEDMKVEYLEEQLNAYNKLVEELKGRTVRDILADKRYSTGSFNNGLRDLLGELFIDNGTVQVSIACNTQGKEELVENGYYVFTCFHPSEDFGATRYKKRLISDRDYFDDFKKRYGNDNMVRLVLNESWRPKDLKAAIEILNKRKENK